MNPPDYFEQVISILLEQDEKIKAQFYSHAYDETPVESLHHAHNKIKSWIERLSVIRDEMFDNGYFESTALNEQLVFCIRRKDMNDIVEGGKNRI